MSSPVMRAGEADLGHPASPSYYHRIPRGAIRHEGSRNPLSASVPLPASFQCLAHMGCDP